MLPDNSRHHLSDPSTLPCRGLYCTHCPIHISSLEQKSCSNAWNADRFNVITRLILLACCACFSIMLILSFSTFTSYTLGRLKRKHSVNLLKSTLTCHNEVMMPAHIYDCISTLQELRCMVDNTQLWFCRQCDSVIPAADDRSRTGYTC